ncbi:MAG: NAD-dependent deacylase [Bacteroidales bacterium]|nr:NAD-dependent deacylase [Bacteroidales bacterium]
MKKKVVALTGAGISAESGLKTFRIQTVYGKNIALRTLPLTRHGPVIRHLCLSFTNKRRAQLATVSPNAAHLALVKLEQKFDVQIITQNVDDLHERAGSSKILHLHGQLTKVRSTQYPDLVTEIGYKEIKQGDLCEKGFQLRPHIVWFGEAVPLIEDAALLTQQADILLIIGTSLAVYPAAGLMHYVRPGCPIYLIDPGSLKYRGSQVLNSSAKKQAPGCRLW